MRINNVKEIVFASSSVVYGEAKEMPTPETYGPCLPISLYGASKLASEGLITAFCHTFDFKCWIYRFANVIGSHATHGAAFDFYCKLKKSKEELNVLGDGKQEKNYIEVTDCVNGMLFGLKNSSESVNLFNLTTTGKTFVSAIAQQVIDALKLEQVEIKYGEGARGWRGDIPVVSLDATKLEKLAWKPKNITSDAAVKEGVTKMVAYLETHAKQFKYDSIGVQRRKKY